MAFLRAPAPEDYLDPVVGRSVVLRPPTAADYAEWAELRALSRAHLTPWEPSWTADDLSRMMFRRRIRAYARDMRDDLGYAFFICDSTRGNLLGGVTLSNVRRGSSQSASLGYWIGAPHAGGGRMQAAVQTLLPFAFGALHLHRIEAATMPANAASIRVLEASGFHREGVARSFLKINGQWEDHILFARLGGLAAAPSFAGARR